ncbi:hypothetical protein CASFOL_004850 [Castilleja foliolosa]|uniref:Uncharacterized protein n=1 Tax=Castilleja foliolosa TaxID=1961234 RepID=A0ABD3EBN0_9LAMI
MVEDWCTMMTTRAESRGGSVWVTPTSCDGGDCRGLCETEQLTNIYFWVSFIPAILILMIGTKLHRIVVKLAVEIMYSSQWTGSRTFNLEDELFSFGNPRLLLQLIQFVSFQNAFEMATYIWSMLVGNQGTFMLHRDRKFLIIRLTFGVVSQFWCSFITFPLYVIVAQMGSKFNKAIVSENVRKSLHGWRRKVKTRNKQGARR